MAGRAVPLHLRVLAAETEICRRAARAQGWPLGLGFYRVVSRLGDGVLWFALAAALPLALGERAFPTVARMAAVGILCTLVAQALKRVTGRPRPCHAHPEIAAGATPLDRWSFPSGHTLHAVAFTAVVVADLPALAFLLVPFTLAVAASRVVLGLHYPTDVAAGALVGGALASAALALL